MADNSHEMKVRVGVEEDLGSISKIGSTLEEQNAQVTKLAKGYKDVADSAKQYSKAMGDIEKKQKQKSSESSSWLSTQKNMYKAGLQSYEEYKENVVKKEKGLYEELKKLSKQKDAIDDSEFQRKLADYQKYLKSVQDIEKQATEASKREAKERATFNQKELNSMISNYKKLNAEVIKMAQPNKSSFSNNMFNSMLSYGVVQQVTGAFQDLGRAIVEIDYNVVNNQRLMGDWSEKTKNSLNSAAAEIAKSTGIQITDAQQIQGAWIRINDEYAKSPELLNKISNLTSKFMNVGEIEDAESAVALLNASLLQFGVSADNAVAKSEEFLNKWAYMADVTAMGTADEYGEAISRYGSQLVNLGGTMDDAIAQSSVLADRLAMNGNEAGNALKTFNTYLSRDKTVKLFNDIANSTGDVSFQLADANGQLKDYRDLLETVARAYQMYKDSGNDLMANKVLDAVGATRRRDVATAMLDAVNAGDYQEYLDKIGKASTSYLEDQNAALMDTLKNQWNALVVSMQQAGMELGNAGILDGMTMLVQGASAALDAFSALPQPIKDFASTLLMVKTASAGLSKLGEITGITEKFKTAMQSGGQASREMAADLAKSSQGFVDIQKMALDSTSSIEKQTESYSKAQSETKNYVQSLSNLNEAYAHGTINADQYSEGVKELSQNYSTSISAIKQNAQAQLEDAQAKAKAAQGSDQLRAAEERVEQAKREVAAVSKLEAQATQQAANVGKQYANAQQQQSIKTKLSMTSIKQKIASLVGLTAAEATSTGATKSFTWAQIASAGATKLAQGAVLGLKAAFSTLFGPLSLVMMAVSFLPSLFGSLNKNAGDLQGELDKTSEALEECKNRAQELQDIESQRGLTGAEQAELDYLDKKIAKLEQAKRIQEQDVNNAMWSKGSDDEDSYNKQSSSAIKSFENAQRAVKNYKTILDRTSESSKNYESSAKNLAKANDELISKAADLVVEYEELKQKYDEGLFSGEEKDQVKTRLDEMEKLIPSAEKLVNSMDKGTDAANRQAQAMAQLNQDLEEYSKEVSELEQAQQGLQGVFDKHIQGTTFDTNEMYEILNIMPELRTQFKEVGEGQYEVIGSTEEIMQSLTQEIMTNKDAFVDAAMAGEEAYMKTGDAVEDTTNKVSDSIQKQKEAIEDLTNAQQAIKDAMGDSFNFETDVQELTFKVNFENKDEAIQGISDIQSKIDEVKNSDIDPEVKTAKLDYLTQQLGQAILKKQELAQPTYMSIDVSSATGDMATLVSYLQEYTTLKNEIEYNQAIGVDTSDAETKLEGLAGQIQTLLTTTDDKNVEIGVDPKVDNFQEELNAAIDGEKIDINADLVIKDDGVAKVIDDVNQKMADIKDVDATVSVKVEGKSSVDNLIGSIDKVKGKEVNVKAKTSGKSDVDKLTDAIKKVDNKEVTVKAVTSGKTDVDNLVTSISNVKSKTVYITSYTTKYTTNINDNGKVNGTAHVNGTATRSLPNGNAYAGGNWGLPNNQVALTGELGKEVVVRGNKWFTVGDNGAEFVSLRKGDIVFNHIQSEELLRNGYVTSGGGRGRALAQGTAYADGYKSSYKITDDKIIAGTIAVQREAKKAAEAAQKAARASDAAANASEESAEEMKKAAEEMKKAADEAAQAAKEVENLTQKYIKNVEDLQRRIAESLKKSYQDEYKEREKLLEKEHNARIESLQKEIDLINGETAEDKEAELARLKEQLAKWEQDDSTLGRRKQQEYKDAIADLEKEIKIDKLQQQIDEENKRYDEATDPDSENFDDVLQDILDKMTDEELYRKANDMIRRGDVAGIKALLSQYDANWDGWETLMGKTADQILEETIRNALNNYEDVVGGTVYPNGGHHTDGVPNPAPQPAPQPQPTPPPPPQKTVQVGSTINAGGARIYGDSSGNGGGAQYFGYDPIYVVTGERGDFWQVRWHGQTSGVTGWFRKSDVKPYKTGGLVDYTGLLWGDGTPSAPERMLSAQQTKAFDNLVYDFLPRLSNELLRHGSTNNSNVTTNNNGNTFNKELVKVEIDKVEMNTPYDVQNSEDNMDRLFRRSLRKAGIITKK